MLFSTELIELFPPRSIISSTPLPADKLKSIDFGTVIDILGEGQIEGSATASKAGITDKTSVAYNNAFLKDLFLNKIAVLQADADNTNPDSSEFNFPIAADSGPGRISFDFQDGTANNKVLFAAESQSFSIFVDTTNNECTFPVGGTATPRSGAPISDVRIDTVQVKVKFDQFFKINSEDGNRESTKVDVIIKVNPNNGSAITVFNEEVKGKSFNPYNRDYAINLRDLTGYNDNTSGDSGSFFPIVISLERGNDVGDENTLTQCV